MEVETETVAAAALCLLSTYNYYLNVYHKQVIKKKWRKRRRWMLSIHRNRTRQSMANQLSELVEGPSGGVPNFVRMSDNDFEYLLQKISPVIAKQDTRWRESIPAKVRLAVTLRFLATGDSYRSLHKLFKISSQVISNIVPEVCLALSEVLKDFVKTPTTANEWLTKAEGFGFPHCVGAMDGKHISLLSPSKSGSEYINYKGGFSIVLLALVDSDYCFMFADIGSPGRISDGDIFNQSILCEKIRTNSINLPQSCPLPGSNIDLPYVFLADGAFALSNHIMKPFPGYHEIGIPERIFNQKFSSSHVTVENTFGIMSAVFRIFKKPMDLDVVKASTITKTCIALHNFLRKSTTSRNIYTPEGTTDVYVNEELVHPGAWRNNGRTGFLPLQSVPRRATPNANQTRLNFVNYFDQNRS